MTSLTSLAPSSTGLVWLKIWRPIGVVVFCWSSVFKGHYGCCEYFQSMQGTWD